MTSREDGPFAGRGDYTPSVWWARVKAARLKVELDARRGLATPAWVRELAEQDVPGVARPTRRGAA